MNPKPVAEWTDEAVNVYIEEKVCGRCANHRPQGSDTSTVQDYTQDCLRCGRKYDEHILPDYCSSRDLCVDVLIELDFNIDQWLHYFMLGRDRMAMRTGQIIIAEPRLWAEAIVEAHLKMEGE